MGDRETETKRGRVTETKTEGDKESQRETKRDREGLRDVEALGLVIQFVLSFNDNLVISAS